MSYTLPQTSFDLLLLFLEASLFWQSVEIHSAFNPICKIPPSQSSPPAAPPRLNVNCWRRIYYEIFDFTANVVRFKRVASKACRHHRCQHLCSYHNKLQGNQFHVCCRSTMGIVRRKRIDFIHKSLDNNKKQAKKRGQPSVILMVVALGSSFRARTKMISLMRREPAA